MTRLVIITTLSLLWLAPTGNTGSLEASDESVDEDASKADAGKPRRDKGIPAQEDPVAAAFDTLCAVPNTVPMEVAGSRHFVQVELTGPRGKETLRFHVDTGGNTPGLAIDRHAAKRLGFSKAEDLPKRLRIGGREIGLPGGASWIIVDSPAPEAGRHRDPRRKGFSEGQLGAGFLCRFDLCIDPAAGRLGLHQPGAITLSPTTGIPLVLQPGGMNQAQYPFTFIRVGKGGYGVLLDTGATTGMLEESANGWLAAQYGWPRVEGAAGDADMLAGTPVETVLSAKSVVMTFPKIPARMLGVEQNPSLDVGGARFSIRPNGTFEKMFGRMQYGLGPVGAVGNDVLNRYRILIDYRHARAWFVPSNRPPDRSASMVRVGVSLRFRADGCPVITAISDTNDPSVAEALETGDVLVNVDGTDTCKLWHHDVSALLAGEPGEHRKLTVERDGKRQEFNLPVRELLGDKRSPATFPVAKATCGCRTVGQAEAELSLLTLMLSLAD